MNTVFLVVAVVCEVFASCFFMAAALIFATHDQKPLDRETERLLSFNAWFGGGGLAYVYIFSRNWRQCRLGRRCFYAALSFGAVTLGLFTLAARW